MLDARVLAIHHGLLGKYKVEAVYVRVALVRMVRCFEADAGAASDALIYTTKAANVQAATCN